MAPQSCRAQSWRYPAAKGVRSALFQTRPGKSRLTDAPVAPRAASSTTISETSRGDRGLSGASKMHPTSISGAYCCEAASPGPHSNVSYSEYKAIWSVEVWPFPCAWTRTLIHGGRADRGQAQRVGTLTWNRYETRGAGQGDFAETVLRRRRRRCLRLNRCRRGLGL